MTTKMKMMKARELNEKRVIRLTQNVIDGFPHGPGATGASPPALDVTGAILQPRNATDATRPGQNVVGATELEPSTSVAEREPGPDSDAVVGPLRSNCPLHDWSFHDCA
jgi:hypothetical protein